VPLTLLFYPASYRAELAAQRAGKKGAEDAALKRRPSGGAIGSAEDSLRTRFTFVLSKLEQVPLAMSFTKLLQTPVDYHHASERSSISNEKSADKPVETAPIISGSNTASIDVIRLLELTDRASAVQQAAGFEETLKNDPLSNIFSTFAALNAFKVKPHLAVLNASDFADSVASFAEERESDMVIVPWAAAASAAYDDGPASNPLENLFKGNSYDRSPQYAAFVRKVFQSSACDVGLFMDQGLFGEPSALSGGRQHLFLAFHGGPDDRAALDFVLQLCRHPGISATVTRFVKTASDDLSAKSSNVTAVEGATLAMAQYTVHGGVSGGDTMYGAHDTQTQMQSDTADNLTLDKYFADSSSTSLSEATRTALTRITFSTVSTSTPLAASITHAEKAGQSLASPLLVVAGRSRRQAPSHREEMAQMLKEHVTTANGAQSLGICQSSETRNALGAVGTMAVIKLTGSLLVIQSAA
jgi:hypothetical protein